MTRTDKGYRILKHPILVTVPIGCWVASYIFDIASYQVSEPEFLTRGSTWLIAIGLLGAIPAVVTGLIDGLPVPPRTPPYRTLMLHFGLTMTTGLVYTVNYMIRAALPVDRPVSGAMIAVSTVGVILVVTAAGAGAGLAHRHAVSANADSLVHPDIERPPA